MGRYMTDIDKVSVDPSLTRVYEAEGVSGFSSVRAPPHERAPTHSAASPPPPRLLQRPPGHDESSLLFNMMHEFLCGFGIDGFVCRDVRCLQLDTGGGKFFVRAKGCVTLRLFSCTPCATARVGT
jgi:hypothetical protein